MVIFISGKKISENKKVVYSLAANIQGIGIPTAQRIAKKLNIENKKVSELNKEELDSLIKELSEGYVLEDKLREEVQKRKHDKIRLGTYEGSRLAKGLPLRQRTHTNAREAKRRRERNKDLMSPKFKKMQKLAKSKQPLKTAKAKVKAKKK